MSPDFSKWPDFHPCLQYCSHLHAIPLQPAYGEYAWRAKGRGVAAGNASALIRPDLETLPGVFLRAGYRTAVVEKRHLGLGKPEGPDWNGEIKPRPLELGFD